MRTIPPKREDETAREYERRLRAGGLSHTQAKRAVSLAKNPPPPTFRQVLRNLIGVRDE